jgi:hypothetical protein
MDLFELYGYAITEPVLLIVSTIFGVPTHCYSQESMTWSQRSISAVTCAHGMSAKPCKGLIVFVSVRRVRALLPYYSKGLPCTP